MVLFYQELANFRIFYFGSSFGSPFLIFLELERKNLRFSFSLFSAPQVQYFSILYAIHFL